MIKAAIDLGTNTFHLLIGKVDNGRIDTIIKVRRYVFIGQDGLSSISEEVSLRAEKVLKEFSDLISEHGATVVRAVVTESLRSASNGNEILTRWRSALGQSIDIISGLEEAKLAGTAVIYGTGGLIDRSLAVDIGGGSVELILIEGQEIREARSIKCGISVLHRMYHIEDPISDENLEMMGHHLKEALLKSLHEMGVTSPVTLVGIAGSFEVLPTTASWRETPCRIIDTDAIKSWFKAMVGMTLEERRSSDHIPKERGQYIVEALAIISTLIESGLFELHLTCPYSLKEGLLLDH